MYCVHCYDQKFSIVLGLPVCERCSKPFETKSVGIVVQKWLDEIHARHPVLLYRIKILEHKKKKFGLEKNEEEKLLFFQIEISGLIASRKILENHPSVRLYYLMR